jgi:hypothetical protein
MGIRPGRVFAKATAIAMLVVTLAALYLGMRSNFDPSIGPARLIYAFQAVIIGGLGSLWGTLAGGIIIGLAQTIGAAINPEWQILAGHVAFLLGSSRTAARPVSKGNRLMTDANASPPYVVSTHTKASQITATAAVAIFRRPRVPPVLRGPRA